MSIRWAPRPAQAAMSSLGNLVTRALGVDGEVHLEVNEFAVEPQDLFILCSDGLSDMLSDAELAEARAWWEGLSEGEKMRRRDDAASRREAFGIELPEDDDDENWPDGEGWAAVCYDDERA